MSLSPAFLDELRARTTLSTVIARDLALKKAGREFRACCPFHNEKSPSFYVNDDKGFYHCFGCGAHGDTIRWLTDQKGLPFMDAVRQLAEAAGLDVPAQDPRAIEREEQFEKARTVMDRAQRFFAAQLNAPGSDGVAAAFLESREIDQKQVETFGIGFAPASHRGERSPVAHALKDVPANILLELGLLRPSARAGGDPYDFFRARVMVPIHDTRGRVIGFGGRALGDAQPKYLNSPETALFDKGRTLFNYHRAAPAARKNGRLVIVEGYMDVMAMSRAGVFETVAPNGTALTPGQLALAWRLAGVPICCFDGDKAGRVAAARAARTALPHIEPGKSLAFAFPPAGLDPDDLVRREGAAAVSAMLAEPRQLIDVLWEAEFAASGQLSNPDARADLLQRLEGTCKQIRHEMLAREYWASFRSLFEEQVQRTRRPGARAPRRAEAGVGLKLAIDAGIVAGLLRHPHVVGAHYEMIVGRRWQDPRTSAVVDALIDAALAGARTADAFAIALESAGLADQAHELARLAQVPFSFVSEQPSDKTGAELVDAIARMPAR